MKHTLLSRTVGVIALTSFSLVPANAQLAGQLGVLDLTANSGINPATGTAWAEGDQYRLIFLSSTTTDAMSSDITTYNTFVQATAAESTAFPELGSATWKMLGSTLTVDARDNTGTNPTVEVGVPVFLMDGASLLATNNSELWRAPSAVPVSLNENGVEVSNPSTRVFTGSFNNGTGVGITEGGDTALGVPAGEGIQGVQTGQPFHTNNPGLELNFWIREWKEPAANFLPVYAISEPLSVVESAIFTLAISSIEYTSATSQISLTWNSRDGEDYVVKYSADMLDWSQPVHAGVVSSAGSETSGTFDLSGLDVASTETLFFRVERASVN